LQAQQITLPSRQGGPLLATAEAGQEPLAEYHKSPDFGVITVR